LFCAEVDEDEAETVRRSEIREVLEDDDEFDDLREADDDDEPLEPWPGPAAKAI